jgi:malonyl-CoA O-methyltransferase
MNYHARRFDRAAGSYASHAAFQARMAERLLALLPGAAAASAAPVAASGPILELGCGTGLLTGLLSRRFPDADLIATDAAPRMAREAERALGPRPGLRFAVCDASGGAPAPEAIAVLAPFRLAASNALVQWFPDLARHLRWTADLLSPGGLYLASGFDRDNFPELNSILREPPFGYADYPGHPAADLAATAAAAGLELAALETERLETAFPSPRVFLEAIRALGAARRPSESRPMTRARLDLLLRRYQERYSRDGGVAATWMPWYALFRKPATAEA